MPFEFGRDTGKGLDDFNPIILQGFKNVGKNAVLAGFAKPETDGVLE
jgi:hypothetical protein